MLVDFNNIRRTGEDRVPHIPFSRKTEVLVRDGRPYAEFAALLDRSGSGAVTAPEPGGGSVSPTELLRQLL